MRRLWRRLPRELRARLWRALDRLGAVPVRLAVGPARGLTLLVPPSRRAGYRAGRHEPAVLQLLAERLAPGMQVVDAGAYLGYFTLAAAARVGEGGRVWAFEPAPASRRLLERSLGRNRLGQVVVEPRALGARAGRGLLALPPNPSMARLAAAGAAPGPAVPVEVTTLDAWCAESGARPDLVKIDVEGAEGELLEGAAETLRRHRPTLVVELHHGPGCGRPEAVVEWLRRAGYRPRPLAPGGLRAALERLAATPLPPHRLATLHLVATPAERAGPAAAAGVRVPSPRETSD